MGVRACACVLACFETLCRERRECGDTALECACSMREREKSREFYECAEAGGAIYAEYRD